MEQPDLPFKSEAFAAAWQLWLEHRKQIKHPLTPIAAMLQLKRLGAMRERDAIATIEYSAGNGWRGLFDPPAMGALKAVHNATRYERPMVGAVDKPRPVAQAPEGLGKEIAGKLRQWRTQGL